jgi:hypothetical protein
VNRWFGAAIVIAILTVAILVAGPSWLLTACDSPDPGIQGCGVVSAFLVGFVGALLSAGCVLIGVLNTSR